MSTGLSNAATVVGRYVKFLSGGPTGKKALIVAYDPNTNEHTVEFEDGSNSTLLLNKHQFKWLVQDCERAETGRVRMLRAAQRDAVGRKLKVYSKAKDKWYQGTIIEFNEEKGRHKVQFKKNNIKELDLEKKQWRYTDLVGKCPPESMTIATSRFAGVQRQSESSWRSLFGRVYIGSFKSEKDAALARDFYARREKQDDSINFPDEIITAEEIDERRSTYDFRSTVPIGASKFRGVHWQKNRKRWMARYTLSHKGEKNVNLGAFDNARRAALAFDAEARKRGRPDSDLNFPDEHPTDAEIEEWKTNTAHSSMMGSKREESSQYRGVTKPSNDRLWTSQCNITKVVRGLGITTPGPAHLGRFCYEKQAALAFDRVCRKFGVPEKELNFPRNTQLLKEVRRFDDECYFCLRESPMDPVATPCNHVFCRACIVSSLSSNEHQCPCCEKTDITEQSLRPVVLVPWPNKSQKGKRKSKTSESESEEEGADISEGAASNDAVDLDPNANDHMDLPNPEESPSRKRRRGGSRVSQQVVDDYDLQASNTGAASITGDTKSGSDSEESELEADKRPPEETRMKDHHQSEGRFPIGTRFIKEFDQGNFEGEVVGYDGEHYQVYYAEDGDEEELSEHEFDELEVLDGKVVAEKEDSCDGRAVDTETATDDDDDNPAQSAVDDAKPAAEKLRSETRDSRQSLKLGTGVATRSCDGGIQSKVECDEKKPVVKHDHEDSRQWEVGTKYPIGTRFVKEFPGRGKLEGKVTSFDGQNYVVQYEETLDEKDLDDLEIVGAAKSSNGYQVRDKDDDEDYQPVALRRHARNARNGRQHGRRSSPRAPHNSSVKKEHPSPY